MGTLSHDIRLRLRSLKSLLSTLPNSIPFGENHYSFTGFTPSADDNEPSDRLVVEDTANLNSHTLRDLLSDEPLVAVPKPSQPLVTPV
ncbi:hypothetical protein BDY19DRAFT_1061081 [Irpex rosettiformis]|uniref:Uncharacterized protein n=1 Tax=Irpex rosettiformis TaxID=378272 RepID=A0ACB8TMA2_9APHY|nr:hypothetical protein BDY19DRAFT_1061081 [Irpex rosettiformis]